VSARLCRVLVSVDHGGQAAADLYESGDVVVFRRKATCSTWEQVGEGKLANGEILGMPGREHLGAHVYAAVEAALAAFVANPLF